MAEKSILAVLNLYVRIKIRVATIDTNDSVTDSTQSIAASIQKLAEDRGLNGRAFRSSSKANTHGGNSAFSPRTARNPCSPRSGQSLHSPHTYRYALAWILAARLFTLLLRGAHP